MRDLKHILTAFSLLCTVSAQGQQYTRHEVDSIVNAAVQSAVFILPKAETRKSDAYNWKRGALVAGFGFIGGAAMGIHETAVHKPWNFPDKWNPQYWDASKSWVNKYENGDPNLGPKFPLSTSALVWATDAKHLSATVHRAAILGAGITIGFSERRPWWHYAADAVLGFAAYSTSFALTYEYSIWKR